MNKNYKKALLFLRELDQLEQKYGMRVVADYEETIDYDYEESPYVSGGQSYLTLLDEDGNEYTDDKIADYEHKLGDLIDEWHESESDKPLFEYLGFTSEEYQVFVGKLDLK